MDVIVIISIWICIGIIFLFYWIPKKLGYVRLGKILASIIATSLFLLVMYIAFEDQLFSKRDARVLLEEQDIRLENDFEIIQNESSASPGDYYHIFRLRISEKDKQQIIEQIKASPNFKNVNDVKADIMQSKERYFGKKLIQNYEVSTSYVREYFEPSGKEGYAPTYRKITIDKNENILRFEDIDE